MICKNCQNEVKAGVKFCPRCGASQENTGAGTEPKAASTFKSSGNSSPKKNPKKKHSKGLMIGVTVCGIVFISVAVIAAVIISKKGSEAKSVRSENETEVTSTKKEKIDKESPETIAETIPETTSAAIAATLPETTTAVVTAAVSESTMATVAPTPPETVAETVMATMAQESTSAVADRIYETLYVINCNQSITLRTRPSTAASEIIQIPLGAAVSYMETADNGFYKVVYLGNTGYALASYLGTTPPSGSAGRESTTTFVYMTVVNCNESITLRTSPSTSADEICQIPLNAVVTYVEPAANGFYKIIYSGRTGFALASYLEAE